MSAEVQERRFPVRGLQLAARLWQPAATRPLIALHGWLDNAASFDVLAPQLQEYQVLAPDLAGQGFSDHRPLSATYHLWDDLLDIVLLADLMGWQQFSLLGHSRGAMLSVMLAAAFPERVQQLFLVDGVLPLPVTVSDTAQQLRRYVEAYRRERSHRYAASRSEAVHWRAETGGIGEAVAEILASRQLRESPHGWYWHVDQRLKAASAVKMTDAHNDALLAAIRCPVTIFLASRGLGSHPAMQELQQRWPGFDWRILDGHHHLHMTDSAGEIAAQCLASLSC